MVSYGYEIYQDGHLVNYRMSNHWVVHLKLILLCQLIKK